MWRWIARIGLAILLLGIACAAFVWWYDQVGQKPDPNFSSAVAAPAYTSEHPHVLIDQAHDNFHTAEARYKPLAALLTNDGYRVEASKQKFTSATLLPHDILIVANAMGPDGHEDDPAFSPRKKRRSRHG